MATPDIAHAGVGFLCLFGIEDPECGGFFEKQEMRWSEHACANLVLWR